LPHSATNSFSKIILHYLDGALSTHNLYSYSADKAGIAQAIQQKNFSTELRQTLVSQLQLQYGKLVVSDEVSKNISKLADENTFTICTAHQPLIFTGTLYFIYKIAHTISLARQLQNDFQQQHFVPVFYMGTEDSDADEVGTFNFRDQKYTWDVNEQQCVGNISTTEILKLLQQLKQLVNSTVSEESIIAIFEEAYTTQATLADATRFIVNSLFGTYGLVVIDPNDIAFKRSFSEVFEQELLHGISMPLVEKQNITLQNLGYEPQASGRSINLFYIENNKRHRIEKVNDSWHILDTSIIFSQEALLQTLKEAPEKFSTNVLLRPLYQESILPNIAFIGGGGEVAYWLQQKLVFDYFKVQFPMLVLRQSFALQNTSMKALQVKLGLSDNQLFESPEHLLLERAKQHQLTNTLQDLEAQWHKLAEQYLLLADTNNIPLQQSIAAHEARLLKVHARLQTKFISQLKRKDHDFAAQLDKLYQSYFKQGTLQERAEVFIDFYNEWGASKFVEAIVKYCKPYGDEFALLHYEA
jgi:bacillithiol biosynthesis cysteine-adding enzyme BshC